MVAQPVVPAELPPPAPQQVQFAADIKPILETSCLRCHGADRPKGGFSLAARAAALQGGDQGAAIIPGDSTNSPLIHYVSRLVADMEMPPEGKGAALTDSQIALLRAWIDQGMVWDDARRYQTHFSFSPAVRWVTVSGDVGKFREHHWIRRGVAGGLSEFEVAEHRTNGVIVHAEGRALTDDYRLLLDIRKPQSGFVRFGFEQYRRYYDDSGPYYPFGGKGFATQSPNIFSLDRHLSLDTGRAFGEVGMMRPGWPEMVFGYEYLFRDGSKATQEWGPVSQRSLGVVTTRHIFPGYKEIDEDVHVLRFDVRDTVEDIEVENNLRLEFASVKAIRLAATEFPSGQLYPTALTESATGHDHFQIANTFRAEKSIRDWLFLSGGYYYSRFDSSRRFEQDTEDGAGRSAAGTFWAGHDLVVEEDAHVFNVNALAGPWRHASVGLGVMTEFSEQRGFGLINNREGDPDDPLNPIEDEFGLASSRIDRGRVEENLVARFTALPSTVLFAEARLKQERSGKFEEFTGHHEFLRDTDTAVDSQEYLTGFEVSPWRRASLHASYKHRRRAADYDDRRDEQPVGDAGTGYPAFLTARETETDILDLRLRLHPATWMKASLNYRLANGDFHASSDPVFVVINPANPPVLQTPGGRVLAGEHEFSNYGANLTVTPWRRWSLSTTFSVQDSTTWTASYARPTVVPFDGNTYSILASSTFIVSSRTDLSAGYSFSRSRFAQDNYGAGLPLGLDYDLHSVQAGVTHRISTNVSAGLQYGYFRYEEPTARGFNDYTAHLVFATIALRWP
jgi:mono/diheme cytochrome c family protein